MSSAERRVTVIIPTRGQAERADSLRCAIESVVTQQDVCAVPLIVLNGTVACPSVERALRADGRLRLLRREAPGLPAALLAGREAVDTPWFATLDDDDLLLPGALALRVRELERRPDHAVVVTNGYRRSDAGDDLCIPPGFDVNTDPLRALLRRNWLLPGSWLCRSDRVGPSLFVGMPAHRECTYLAARFASEHRMLWLDEPTVVYTVGSPFAVTSSRDYVMGQVDALRRIIALPLPPDVRHDLRGRVAGAYHEAADHDWRIGAIRDAWRWHLASLREPGGWRYLPFTRHLLGAAWRRRS